MIDSQPIPLPEEDWTLIIQPQRNLLDLRLGELWRYRDLVMLFVRRDFVSVYKQTILGPLWYLIQPLLTTITFTVIFGSIARPAHRRPAAVPVLHVRHGGLVLLCRLPDQDQRDLCAERQPVRQGLLPAPGGAGLDPDLEPDHLPDPVRHVPRLCGLVRPARARPSPPTGCGSPSRRCWS